MCNSGSRLRYRGDQRCCELHIKGGDRRTRKSASSGRQSGIGVHGNRMIRLGRNHHCDLRLLRKRPAGRIGNTNDDRAALTSFSQQTYDFCASAAARDYDYNGRRGKGCKLQQLSCIHHVHGVAGAIKDGRHAECGVPTTADPGHIDVASFPDSSGRALQSTLTRSTQVIKSAQQLFGLTEDVVKKVSHCACSASRCRFRCLTFVISCRLHWLFLCRSQDDVSKSDVIVFAALKIDRPRQFFVAVERPPRDAGDFLVINHSFSVLDDGDGASHQRNVEALQFSRLPRQLWRGSDETIDAPGLIFSIEQRDRLSPLRLAFSLEKRRPYGGPCPARSIGSGERSGEGLPVRFSDKDQVGGRTLL